MGANRGFLNKMIANFSLYSHPLKKEGKKSLNTLMNKNKDKNEFGKFE